MKQNSPPIRKRSYIVLTGIIFAILTGGIHAGKLLQQLTAKRSAQPFVFTGQSFEQLKSLFDGERIIGYISDRDMNDKNIGAHFAQTQLAMAPIILDLNNPRHRFLILDCQDESFALTVMQNARARPLKRSNTGIIIAERIGP
jgi:hypothetical protein